MSSYLLPPGLELRSWTAADRSSFLGLFADPEVVRYVGDGVVDTDRDAGLYEKVLLLPTGPTETFAFVLAVCVEGQVGGHFELKVTEDCSDGEWEIIYVLSRAHWGQGIATRLVEWGQEQARSYGKRLVATVDPENHPSIHILRKRGFELRSAADADVLVYAEPVRGRPEA